MKATMGQRLRYKFDNFMSRGIGSMMKGLVFIFLTIFLIIVAVRFVIYTTGATGQYAGDGDQLPFWHHIYLVWLAITDPGNPAQDIMGDPRYKIPAIAAGASGLILMSALVGLITTWLMDRMEQLRKGHSQVIESEHTVILGWDEQRVVEILRELIEANESEKNPSVCILAEEEKEDMDDFLAKRLPEKERLNTRVVTRAGSISSMANLKVASVESCKSVIVLATCNQSAPEREKNQSDARVLKAILALSNCVPATEESELNIVAEVFDTTQRDIIIRTCPHTVSVVDAWDILAKIIVQTSRSVGLSVAYGEMLSFEGCEMYFHNNPKWEGLGFGALQFHFPDGVPLGVRNAAGEIKINPPPAQTMRADDDVLIVAEDDSTVEFRKKPVVKQAPTVQLVESRLEQKLERELIIGWNRMAPIIIEQYADYVLDGSDVTVLLEEPDERVKAEIARLSQEHPGLKIDLVDGDPFDLGLLRSVMPPEKNNIIILNKSGDSEDAEKTDSETIVILLMLRSIFEEANPDPLPNLIAEVADSRNQSLVSSSGVKDFIISNRLVSMLLAQISEEADIKAVYDDLFQEDGSEIYLKPLHLYQPANAFPATLTFADCMWLAQQRQEVCIGIKMAADEENADANFGVEVNPAETRILRIRPARLFGRCGGG